MKQLFFLVFLLNSLSIFAQEPVYTPMRLNYQFRGIKVDSLFLVPSYTDTTQANGYTVKNIGGTLIRTGNDFWMRNASATAWLQNVNVGSGASPVVQFVDSVWRIAGKDSIFWRKAGVTSKIKDSTATDSPDRIFGTATSKITSNFANYDWDVQNVTNLTLNADSAEFTHQDLSIVSNQVYIAGAGTKGLDLYIDTNILRVNRGNKTLLQTDTLGNFAAGDITTDNLHIKLSTADSAFKIQSKAPSTWREKNSGLKSQIKTAYYKAGIDLSTANDTAFLPGTYIIDNGDTNVFYLPDASKYAGQTVYIIIRDDSPSGSISALSGSVLQPDETTYPLKSNSFNTLTSDGTDWWGGYIQY